MGLDAVDLILKVEEEFGVKILDEEAESLKTVGDLQQLLRTQGAIGEVRTPCIPRCVFRKLSEALTQIEAVSVTRLRPSTPMSKALGQEKPSEAWPELATLTGWSMPPLRRPRRLTDAMTKLWCATTLVLLFYLVARLSSFGLDFYEVIVFSIVGALVAGVVLALILKWGTRWARVASPADTLGQLSRQVMLQNSGVILAEYGSIYAEGAGWEKVRKIVAETVGVDVEEVTSDARFVQDLGMD